MHWDLVLKNPLDRKNHTLLSWRNKAWRPSIEPHSAIHDPLFASLGIKPVTTEGSTPGWFLLRGYSFGSSTSDMLLLAIKRYVHQSDDEPNEEILEAAQPILAYLHINSAEGVRAEAWGNTEEEVAPAPENAEEPDGEGTNDDVAVDNDGMVAALLEHAPNSIEYVKLKVKELLTTPIDSVHIDVMLEHITMEEEISDEVRIFYC
jgi:hypothetical protein